MGIIAGRADLEIDGTKYVVGDAMTIDPQTEVGESIVGMGGFGGTKLSYKMAKVTGTIMNGSDVLLRELYKMRDFKARAGEASGKNYSLSGANFTGDLALDVNAGTISFTIEAKSCTEEKT
jgi:hypothetical protein